MFLSCSQHKMKLRWSTEGLFAASASQPASVLSGGITAASLLILLAFGSIWQGILKLELHVYSEAHKSPCRVKAVSMLSWTLLSWELRNHMESFNLQDLENIGRRHFSCCCVRRAVCILYSDTRTSTIESEFCTRNISSRLCLGTKLFGTVPVVFTLTLLHTVKPR